VRKVRAVRPLSVQVRVEDRSPQLGQHAADPDGRRSLTETVMTKALAALVAAATLATVTAAVPTTADARCVGCAIGAGERPAEAPPGYAYYPYGEPLPGPNCNWFRVPVYDAYGNMVGRRGRPVAFCSWLAGFRPWPL
jgi:hypothetical protein